MELTKTKTAKMLQIRDALKRLMDKKTLLGIIWPLGGITQHKK